jgi:hypothetical protein
LPIPQKLYNVIKRLKTKEEVEDYFPGFLAFTDSTEQLTHSKTSKEQGRKENYTTLERKRSTRSVKNLYTDNQKGLLIYKTKRRQRGRRHDYRIYKKNHPDLPKDVMSMYDLGFFWVKTFQSKGHPYQSKRRKIMSKLTTYLAQFCMFYLVSAVAK